MKIKKIILFLVLVGAIFLAPRSIFAHETHKEPIGDTYNNYILSDTEFTAQNTMSVEQIQVFLNSKVPVCDTYGTTKIYDPAYKDTVTRKIYSERRGYATPFTCLKDYSEGGKTAAQIIYETAQSVGINPQVILVTLQKEQSLVTDNWPWTVQYRSAMGMGCPEGADCNSVYYGYTNQVLRGAQLLKAVYNKSCNPDGPFYIFTYFNTFAGTSRVLDGKSTYVGNCATAAFYQYTPHRPDSAYLTASNGSHYYGNYNFIYFYNEWFGAGKLIKTHSSIYLNNINPGVGENVTVTYTLINQAPYPVTLDKVAALNRINDNGPRDFDPVTNVELAANGDPGGAHTKTFTFTKSFAELGKFTTWAAFQYRTVWYSALPESDQRYMLDFYTKPPDLRIAGGIGVPNSLVQNVNFSVPFTIKNSQPAIVNVDQVALIVRSQSGQNNDLPGTSYFFVAPGDIQSFDISGKIADTGQYSFRVYVKIGNNWIPVKSPTGGDAVEYRWVGK